jgi:predicted ATPase
MVPPEELEEGLKELRQGFDSTNDDVLKIVPRGNKFMVIPTNIDITPFLIYSLEESKLRQADNSNRTYPLGRHGEGLFAYLKELSQRPDSNTIFEEIKEHLKILDWFDDLEVPTGQLSMEFNLKLKDSYLTDTLNTFDQRSTNEGFLYLLFYLTLIISDETPRFFGIENIDTAFNPKLCREVTRRLIELSRKHNKQIIATTHNPAVLDGINLYEDDVRLLVVRRTIDGYTKTNRVTLKGEMTMPLSEAWQKGFIGGLPDNF